MAKQIQYRLDINEAHKHYFQVTISVELEDNQEYQDFIMPVWTPGSYLNREFAKNVQEVSAYSGERALTCKKVNKHTWRIELNNADKATINYKVYAYEMSVRTSFLDASHAMINAASVFMTAKGLSDQPFQLAISAPKDWNKISTGLESVGDKWTLQCDNYDHLVDSPIEIGKHETHYFEVLGIQHELAIIGDANLNREKLLADIQKIVKTEGEFFGELPYDRYVFFIYFVENGYGGLEHKNSSANIFKRWGLDDKKQYQKLMGLLSHEFFHTWNVKRIRPEKLGPFNYESETYTELLWIAEGVTAYYDNRFLYLAGLATEEEYLTMLSDDIKKLDNTAGRKVMSLAESSYDAWVKLYRANENSNNSIVSYYLKGSLLMFLLDMKIRAESKGERSLDDVYADLWDQFKKNGEGLTEAGFFAACTRVWTSDYSDILNYIHSTDELNFQEYLAPFGLSLEKSWKEDDDRGKSNFGMSMNSKLRINKLDAGEPAYEAGLNVHDELIAMNGRRLSSENYKNMLANTSTSEASEFLLSRGGDILKIWVQAESMPENKYSLKKSEDQSENQKRLFDLWLPKQGD